jgi:hypothetical protein
MPAIGRGIFQSLDKRISLVEQTDQISSQLSKAGSNLFLLTDRPRGPLNLDSTSKLLADGMGRKTIERSRVS